MGTVTLKGDPIETAGDLPAVGSDAPDFTLVAPDLSEISKAGLAGKRVILNIFPSVDTPVCAGSVRRFNESASSLENTVVLCVSMDLPFAQARFCGAEGLDHVQTGSDFRGGTFGKDYGIEITTGPLAGLLARGIVIFDEAGKVVFTELVPEIAQEPDYDAALAAL